MRSKCVRTRHWRSPEPSDSSAARCGGDSDRPACRALTHLVIMMRSAEFIGSMPRPTREERLARIDALSRLLDTAFTIPGTTIRFGLDALIGLVPGIGDA